MKKQKPLWRISAATAPEAEDAVGELLASVFGVAATAYFDLDKQTSLVSVFMEQGKFSPAGARREIAAGLKRIAGFGLNVGAGKIEIVRVKREDWAESWKRHFQPIEIGKTLLVKPSWSKKCPAKNQAVVILDPGLSFGTGQHPTTSFCLNEIARCQKSGTARSFLDIGNGSTVAWVDNSGAGSRLVTSPVSHDASVTVPLNQATDRVTEIALDSDGSLLTVVDHPATGNPQLDVLALPSGSVVARAPAATNPVFTAADDAIA